MLELRLKPKTKAQVDLKLEDFRTLEGKLATKYEHMIINKYKDMSRKRHNSRKHWDIFE